MTDQYNQYRSDVNRGDSIDDSVDYDPTSDAAVTNDTRAYPNHGIDGRSGDDAAKGGVLGAVGGAVVGALAGGPVGAVIGAVVGGVASDAGVAAVDHVDNDNSPGERNTQTGTAYSGGSTTVVDNNYEYDANSNRIR